MTRRFSLWYFLAIGSLGAFHPYLAVVLDHLGATGAQLAAVIAVFPLGLLLSGPVWAWLADRTQRAQLVLRLALGVTLGGAIWIALSDSWFAMLVGVVVLASSRAPCMALVDMLVLQGVKLGAQRYGRLRLWGSIGFIAAVVGVGAVMSSWQAAPLVINAAMLGAAFVLTFWLPSPPKIEVGARRPSVLLKNGPLRRLYVVAALHVISVSSFDHLFALHAERMHLTSGLIGVAVALGVAMEVLVMAAGPYLLARLRPRTLILAGVAVGIPWALITGSTMIPIVLVFAQSLHGLCFGAFWIGGVAWIFRHSPEGLRNTAQSLFMAFGWGIGTLLSMGGAALLLDTWGTGPFFLLQGGVSTVALIVGLALLARRESG